VSPHFIPVPSYTENLGSIASSGRTLGVDVQTSPTYSGVVMASQTIVATGRC
jgi:hypothetical protein